MCPKRQNYRAFFRGKQTRLRATRRVNNAQQQDETATATRAQKVLGFVCLLTNEHQNRKIRRFIKACLSEV